MTIMTLMLAVIAGIAFFFAYRERTLYLATRSATEINRSIMRDCSALMDEPDTSKNLKEFVSHVAVMAGTTKLQQKLGANAKFATSAIVQAQSNRQSDIGRNGLYRSLTAAEREKVRGITSKYALAAMAFNPQHGGTVRLLVETDIYNAMIDRMQNPKAPHTPTESRRAQEVAKVSSRIPQIEQLVADQLCAVH